MTEERKELLELLKVMGTLHAEGYYLNFEINAAIKALIYTNPLSNAVIESIKNKNKKIN